MAAQVSKSRFKAHALEIFRQIEKTGTPVVITDNGKPALTVTRYQPPTADTLASVAGSVLRFDDPLAPVDEAWDAHQ